MMGRFRFGFLSLFAAMLLAVSAAGWWKFHSDLYVEEIEALQTLRRAGVAISVTREKSGWAEAKDDESVPWNAPLIGPLETVYGDRALTQQERDVVLTLPRLKIYYELPTIEEDAAENAPWRPDSRFDVASFLGSEPPALEEPALPIERLDEPLPTGVPVDELEAERIAEAILDAWRNPGARPSRYLIHAQTEDETRRRLGGDDVRQLLFQSGDRALRYRVYLDPVYPESVNVVRDRFRLSYSIRGEVSTRHMRVARYDADQFREEFRNFPDDLFPYHGLNFDNWRLVERTFDAIPRLDLERVEKIDDVRYRIAFAPFAAERNDDERQDHATDPKVIQWNCVLRSDLDWAPEQVHLVETIQYTGDPKPLAYERRMVQRFRRQDGYVLLAERLLQDQLVGGVGEPHPFRTRWATDLDPIIADRAFEPATLDPAVWPEPRPLPVWRWYRITFAISLALFAFLIGRSVVAFFGRQMPAQKAANDVAPSNAVPADDEATIAPTPDA